VALEASASFMLAWEVQRITVTQTVPALVGAGVLCIYAIGGYLYRTRFVHHPVMYLLSLYASIAALILVLRSFYPMTGTLALVLRLVMLAVFIGLYSIFRNQRAQVQEEMNLQATVDPLTGALTRNGLKQWLKAHPNGEGAIFMVDLDDFKPFNDIWGHRVGDEVLEIVADRIRNVCRAEDAVVRPGGDEFSIWVPGLSTAAAGELAEHIHSHVADKKMEFPDCTCTIGISVGWAVGPLNFTTYEAADQALLRSKHTGKNHVSGSGDTFLSPRREVRFSWWEIESARRMWWSSASAVALTNATGEVLMSNPAYRKFMQAFHVNDMGAAIQATAKNPTSPSYSLLHQRQDDESLAWALQYCEPVLADDGSPSGYFIHVRRVGQGSVLETLRLDWEDVVIDPVFQPIIELKSGSILGYEALSRPTVDGVPVPPMDLFAMATELQQTAQLDEKCLDALIAELERPGVWLPDKKLFVNIRADTLNDSGQWKPWIDKLTNIVGASRLIWELSEEGISPAKTTAIHILLHSYPNAHWAIDDWGSGHNFVPTNKDAVPTWIKLDRNLVKAAFVEERTRKLLLLFMDWAQSEGIHTVAEGIETAEEARLVTEWGIYAGQGYYWGYPGSLVQYDQAVD